MSDELTPKQLDTITALLTEPTNIAACKKVGIVESTLYAWLQQPEFMVVYRKSRARVFEQAIASLQRISQRAAEVLGEKIESKDDNTAIRAATAILDRALKGMDLIYMAERFEEIEKRLGLYQ